MQQTRILMGMPITVEIVDDSATTADLDRIYTYFAGIDDRFSTYKQCSEITQLNMGHIAIDQVSPLLHTVLTLSEQTKQATDGYFDVWRDGGCDPSGLVKGWAIHEAAQLLRTQGFRNFYIEAGGDIQTAGVNATHESWRVGIRNPFDITQIVKILYVGDCGVATSGNYIRGAHIYNPKSDLPLDPEIVSLTVIGPNVYEADRFATAAFAMGRRGIAFIANLPGFEGYQIDQSGHATFTNGFERFTRYV